MTINVTPIPKLTAFATPAITIGPSASAGTAATVIRSDSTIAGVALITSVDETIARYNGTAGQLQGYSSLPPTISDAGIISLTSGALQFPATAIASGNVNTLDDYEEGTWTPGIGDNGLDGSGEGQVYGAQTGRYTKIGQRLFVQGYVEINSLGTLTTSEGARITGLPFASVNVSNVIAAISCGIAGSLAMPASNQSVTGFLQANESVFTLRLWDTSTGNTALLVSEVSAGGTLGFSGSYEV
jgi:hypothetical protein